MNKKFLIIIFALVFISCFKIVFTIKAAGDFVLSPAKIEVVLDAGETVVKEITIINRLGRAADFKVEIEDFEGSQDKEKPAVLLGENKGQYSLRDYLKPEQTEFFLGNNQSRVLPIIISVPQGVEPGGLYSAVLISVLPEEGDASIKTKGRIGCLFFVRVNGQAIENGKLEKFEFIKNQNSANKNDLTFGIAFRNQGNVHLNPYGYIAIKNIFGKEIERLSIEPYFTMPNSLRYLKILWQKRPSIGKYTATLFLNRGYQDIIENSQISFYVIPWQFILASIFILLMAAFLIWFFVVRFKTIKKANVQ